MGVRKKGDSQGSGGTGCPGLVLPTRGAGAGRLGSGGESARIAGTFA